MYYFITQNQKYFDVSIVLRNYFATFDMSISYKIDGCSGSLAKGQQELMRDAIGGGDS